MTHFTAATFKNLDPERYARCAGLRCGAFMKSPLTTFRSLAALVDLWHYARGKRLAVEEKKSRPGVATVQHLGIRGGGPWGMKRLGVLNHDGPCYYTTACNRNDEGKITGS